MPQSDCKLDLFSIRELFEKALHEPMAIVKNKRETGGQIASDPNLAKYTQELRELADSFLKEPLEVIPFSLHRLFDQTGDRNRFQASYFAHRRRLVALGLASWIFSRPEYIQGLEDILWAICDEYSWALPAHMGGKSLDSNMLEANTLSLDLFSCETAFALAEICDLLEDELSPVVVARARGEVSRRVLDPFIGSSEPFGWESSRSNWCAVCCGSVGAAALYLVRDPVLLAEIVKRLICSLDNFLESFSSDGACLEGLGYWSYGVGFYVAFSDLLFAKTGGGVDLVKNERFKDIASFQSSAYLNGKVSVSFADGSPREHYRRGLSAWLAMRFPGAALPDPSLALILAEDTCGRWALSFRDFLWSQLPPVSAAGDVVKAGYTYLPDAQWLIVPESPAQSGAHGCGLDRGKRLPLAFAAKGGNNAEPHNHNDVGSFIVASGDDVFLADLGCGEYVRDYFNENRYTIFCNSSMGHSLPVINGRGQCAGVQYAAVSPFFNEDGNVLVFSLEIQKAYDCDVLRRFVRRFEFDLAVNRLSVIDDFEFEPVDSPIHVVERFISPLNPRCVPGERDIFFDGDGSSLRLGIMESIVDPEMDSIQSCVPSMKTMQHEHREHDGTVVLVSSLDLDYLVTRRLRCGFEFEAFDRGFKL